MANNLDGNFGNANSFLSFVPVMIEQATGHRIKEKARSLFMQYGLRSVSMDDIANQLGISKKTIYQYFEDKDELVDAVMQDEFTHNESRCEADRKRSLNAIDELFLAMEMVIEMFNQMNPALLFDMQKYYPNTFNKFLKHKNDYIYNIIRENLIRGIREGYFRPEIDIDLVSWFRMESMLWPFNPEFFQKTKKSLAVVEQELILHYLYGLASPKGYELISTYQLDRLNNEKK